MHILITNDDGIFSSGIRTLADCAIRRGHRVTISAPNRQCSANSQHITLTSPILTHRIDWPGAEAWAVDGTPADCVRILADQLQDKPDLCPDHHISWLLRVSSQRGLPCGGVSQNLPHHG